MFLKMLVSTRIHGVIIQNITREIFTIMKTPNFTMRLHCKLNHLAFFISQTGQQFFPVYYSSHKQCHLQQLKQQSMTEKQLLRVLTVLYRTEQRDGSIPDNIPILSLLLKTSQFKTFSSQFVLFMFLLLFIFFYRLHSQMPTRIHKTSCRQLL